MKQTSQPIPNAQEFGCACVAVRHVARLVTQLYEEELRVHLAMPQFGLLSVIAGHPGSNQAALARALDFDKTTLSRNLKLMQKKGWIARAASGDRRERGYQLTPEGSQLLAEAKPAWARAQNRFRSAMSSENWHAMWQTLGTITEVTRHVRRES